MLKQHKFQKA